MPYTKQWKDYGFKRGIIYTYYDFTKYQRKMIARRFGSFCTGDTVEFK